MEQSPGANLAEVGHAKMSSAARKYMSLIEAARDDVAAPIRQEAEIDLFDKGLSKGGKGPDQQQRLSKVFNREMKRARAFCDELDAEGIEERKEGDFYIPKKGIHQPPARRKQAQSQPTSALSQTTSEGGRNLSRTSSEPGQQPFHVILFGSVTNLKRCYGCKSEFKDKYKSEPYDVILKHYCYRRYKDKSGNYVLSNHLQAAYFHLNLDCARKQAPHMELENIIVHHEVRSVLSKEQKQVLIKFGVVL